MWKDGKVITGERMNDGMLYGNNVVQGTDIDGDTKNDTRDFEGAAGNSTQYLAERELCLVDITKRQVRPHPRSARSAAPRAAPPPAPPRPAAPAAHPHIPRLPAGVGGLVARQPLVG